jgi:hypothetical protein
MNSILVRMLWTTEFPHLKLWTTEFPRLAKGTNRMVWTQFRLQCYERQHLHIESYEPRGSKSNFAYSRAMSALPFSGCTSSQLPRPATTPRSAVSLGRHPTRLPRAATDPNPAPRGHQTLLGRRSEQPRPGQHLDPPRPGRCPDQSYPGRQLHLGWSRPGHTLVTPWLHPDHAQSEEIRCCWHWKDDARHRRWIMVTAWFSSPTASIGDALTPAGRAEVKWDNREKERMGVEMNHFLFLTVTKVGIFSPWPTQYGPFASSWKQWSYD